LRLLPGSDEILRLFRLDFVDILAPQGQQVKYSEITRSGWVQVMIHGTGAKAGDKHSIASFIEDVKLRFRSGSSCPLFFNPKLKAASPKLQPPNAQNNASNPQ
jgi:hypothetical protein